MFAVVKSSPLVSRYHGTTPPVQVQSSKRHSPTKTPVEAACTPTKPTRTSKQCIMLTVSGAVTTATSILSASLTGLPSSSRYCSTYSKINGNSEMKHLTAATTPSTHSSIAHDSVTKLYNSTLRPSWLGLSWHSASSSYPDHSPLLSQTFPLPV
jgi:hypothetical protein